VRDTRYQWAYLFGAVCPERKLGAGLVMPYANTEAMNKHLQEIARRVTPGAHAIVVLDGAGWHGSRELIVPDTITLLPLPPYSPELNPAENIWEYLRKNKLSNRLYQTYDDIVDACCEAWNYLMARPQEIASIATRTWAKAS
jgi:transposase